ncbi:hypothetical protein Tco_1156641 [Tanacetum coccineum]
MVLGTAPLIGFSGEVIWPMGQILLPVKIGDAEQSTSTWMNFMVMRSPSLYNGIIGRPGSSRIIPLECTMVSGPEAQTSNRKDERHCARCNLDIFAWKQADMTGVSRHIAKHRLNVREGCSLIRQKKRGQAPEETKQYKMSLKNARATYQRLVDKAFQKQIGRNLELNPKKCTFGIEKGMFLGCKVNTKGIKVCPDKVEAVLSLPSPKYLKDVQKLNGKLASLNRPLSKSAEKSLPFFKILKKCTKKSDFQWNVKAEVAFKQIKKLTAELPTLTAPMEKEELIMYLTAAREVVSAVLMTEREARQMSV